MYLLHKKQNPHKESINFALIHLPLSLFLLVLIIFPLLVQNGVHVPESLVQQLLLLLKAPHCGQTLRIQGPVSQQLNILGICVTLLSHLTVFYHSKPIQT